MQWIATQASLNGVNLYIFISLEKVNPIGQVYFMVPNPAAVLPGLHESPLSLETADINPTFFTISEISTAVYTIVVTNTNLTLTATDAPTQIVVQPLDATNSFQHWQFTPVS